MNKAREYGLANRIRVEMQKRRKPFTPLAIAKAIGLKVGQREQVGRALPDFVRRGEVLRVGKEGRTSLYLYNRDYCPAPRPVPKKSLVLRAVYVSGTFSSADIQRLAGTGVTANYIQQILRRLVNEGYLELLGEQKRERSYGLENAYRLIDREVFRKEVLG